MSSILKKLMCIGLCTLMLAAVACEGQDDQPSTEQAVDQTENSVEVDLTQEGTTQEELVVKEARAIGERYFIYRIWNFTPQTQAQFEATVDAAAQPGFNAIKVHIPWSRVENTTAGVYDFSAFDPMIEYVVKTKEMKVAISIDLTRRADDTIISLDQMQYDPNGNLCQGGSIDGMRTMISFCSESAVGSAVAFYSAVVEHYEALYSSDVLFYLPAFSQYAESEYWCAGEYDYSDLAKVQFRAYLKEKYASIEKLNYVLGTEYTSFDQIEPPSSLASDNFGQLWYQFRHLKLKGMIDALALAQKQISPNSKYCLQFGSIYDTASILRCTLAAADLAEYADIVWIDDGPNTEHEFSMDHANATFPSHVLLAQEIDGPVQVGATPEKYLEQGNDAFSRGCTYLSIANWHIDDAYREYEWVWKQLIEIWLSDQVPQIVDTTLTEPAMEISLTDHLRKGNPGTYLNEYYSLAPDGRFVNIRVVDDLTHKDIDQPNAVYAFPGSFSNQQGKGCWYYMSYRQKSGRGKFTEMTFDVENNRWQGESAFTLIMNGSMHPDGYDSALVFEVPRTGKIVYTLSAGLTSLDSDGVKYAVMLNDQFITEGDNGYILISGGEICQRSLEIDVQEGDRIAFVLNVNKTSTNDSTAVSVTVEYVS